MTHFDNYSVNSDEDIFVKKWLFCLMVLVMVSFKLSQTELCVPMSVFVILCLTLLLLHV